MERPIAKDMRIVFMGTPDFAVSSLKTLVENHYNIVAVITAADKPAGRGQKLRISAVKKFALENDLNLLQPTNLKSESFISELRNLQPDLQIVVAFRMLPEVVWKMPRFGTFNLHASLLPDYRGAAPIHWAIINGEKETGVTTFFIDEKIDTGAILLSQRLPIGPDETVGELHDKLMKLGDTAVVKTIEGIASNSLSAKPQPKKEITKTAYKLNRENCKINWTEDAVAVYNKIRGLNPFPSAWCYLENGGQELMVKIFEIGLKVESHNEEIGSIKIGKDELNVAAKNGFISIREIQLPGKRKMPVKSLLNGFKFESDSKFR